MHKPIGIILVTFTILASLFTAGCLGGNEPGELVPTGAGDYPGDEGDWTLTFPDDEMTINGGTPTNLVGRLHGANLTPLKPYFVVIETDFDNDNFDWEQQEGVNVRANYLGEVDQDIYVSVISNELEQSIETILTIDLITGGEEITTSIFINSVGTRDRGVVRTDGMNLYQVIIDNPNGEEFIITDDNGVIYETSNDIYHQATLQSGKYIIESGTYEKRFEVASQTTTISISDIGITTQEIPPTIARDYTSFVWGGLLFILIIVLVVYYTKRKNNRKED